MYSSFSDVIKTDPNDSHDPWLRSPAHDCICFARSHAHHLAARPVASRDRVCRPPFDDFDRQGPIWQSLRVTVATEGDDFATAEVEVSIDTTSIDTREATRDAHLRSADFFDTDRYPTITFKSRRVTPASGHGRYTVVGDLTIRDITREIALDVTTEGFVRDPWGNDRAGFSAHAALNRKDYGLVWNVALETGGVVVGDEVKLSFDVELTKTKST